MPADRLCQSRLANDHRLLSTFNALFCRCVRWRQTRYISVWRKNSKSICKCWAKAFFNKVRWRRRYSICLRNRSASDQRKSAYSWKSLKCQPCRSSHRELAPTTATVKQLRSGATDQAPGRQSSSLLDHLPVNGYAFRATETPPSARANSPRIQSRPWLPDAADSKSTASPTNFLAYKPPPTNWQRHSRSHSWLSRACQVRQGFELCANISRRRLPVKLAYTQITQSA